MWLVLGFLNIVLWCFLLGFVLACAWCCIVGVYQWGQTRNGKRALKRLRMQWLLILDDLKQLKKRFCLILLLIMLGGCVNQTPALEIVNGKIIRVLPATVNYLAENDPNALKDININNELIRNK